MDRLSEKLSATVFLVILGITAPPIVTFPSFLVLLVLRKAVPVMRPLSPSADQRFTRVMGYFLTVGVIMALLNAVLIQEGTVVMEWSGIRLYSGGLAFGGRTGARLLLLSAALLIFFQSTDLARIAAFLHHVGLHTQIVMSLLLTMHFLTALPGRVERIFAAQQARGAPIRTRRFARISAFFSVLSPLVLSSIVESIDRGMALQLRGFSSETRLVLDDTVPIRLTPLTVVFIILSLMALVLPWLPL